MAIDIPEEVVRPKVLEPEVVISSTLPVAPAHTVAMV